MNDAPHWGEDDSQRFIDLGRIYTPRRDEILDVFLDLVPADPDEPFHGVELGVGAGWLIEGVLERYPNARMTGLDGSPAMLEETGRRLARFGARAELARFELSDQAWRSALPGNLRLIVSSLVIHHLNGPGKQRLFADMFARLEPGGALLICDLVEPSGRWGKRHMARAWDAEVARQSLELTGSSSSYDQFVTDEWNLYRYPDTEGVDFPSPLMDQLEWLQACGFKGVDAWWVRAGHAVFGGFKP